MTIVLTPGTRTGGPAHGWEGCCLAHDDIRQAQADRYEGDHRACEECGLQVDVQADRDAVQPDRAVVCEPCRRDIELENHARAMHEDDDWRFDR